MVADRKRWIIVALVFVAIMLNYVDRQILALLKPTLETEYRWSDQDYANMLSGFQVAAAVAFLGTGWFIDRVGLKRGFALGVALWSLAGMAHAMVSSVTGFITARVVLGAAESVGTPAAVKSAAVYFTQKERSVALGIGNTAPNVGAVVTPLIVPALAVAFGWRSAFLAAGVLGIVWVGVWLAVRVPPVVKYSVRPVPIRWADLFRRRETAAIAIAKVLADQVWFFMLAWLPDLFHRMFGLPQGTVGLPVALAYSMAAAGALTGGWLPTRLMTRGWSVNRARKGTLLLYAVLVLPVTLVLVVDDAWSAALLLGLGLFAHQGFSTNLFALATDIVPARAVGSTIGIAAFCGNMWSIVLIQLAAVSLAAGYGYGPLLGICSISYLLALGIVQLIIPRIVAVPEDGSGSYAIMH